MAVDDSQNVYCTGWLADGPDDYSFYLEKFDSSGIPLWYANASAPLSFGRAVATDPFGNVVVTGDYGAPGDFGGGVLPHAGGNDIFIAKFDPQGIHMWSRSFGGPDEDGGYAIVIDALGGVYVTGCFEGQVGWPLEDYGMLDMFLLKMSPDGLLEWVQSFGGASDDGGYGLAVDAEDNILVTGSFTGSIEFGGGFLEGYGAEDILLAKFDSDGTYIWSRSFGCDSDLERGWDVAVDPADNVVMTGRYAGAVDFGTGALPLPFQTGVFLAIYDPDGQPLWSDGFIGLGNTSGYSVAAGRDFGIALSGFYGSEICFGGDVLVGDSELNAHAFLAKFTDDSFASTPERTELDVAVMGYPNPFLSSTRIHYVLPRASDVRVDLFDAGGRCLGNLVDGSKAAGGHTLTWQGRSDGGEELGADVCFLRLVACGQVQTRRLTRLR